VNLLAVLAFAAPVARGAVVMERIAALMQTDAGDADIARVAGTTANAVGGFDIAAGLLATAVSGLRTQGPLGLLATALTQQAWSSVQRADLSTGIPIAQEAEQLARETTQPTTGPSPNSALPLEPSYASPWNKTWVRGLSALGPILWRSRSLIDLRRPHCRWGGVGVDVFGGVKLGKG